MATPHASGDALEPLPERPPDPPPNPHLSLVPDRAAAGARTIDGRSSRVRLEHIDAPAPPVWVKAAFALMYALAAVLAAHQLLGWGGPGADRLVDVWLNNLVFIGSGAVTAWRAIRFQQERAVWSCFAAALLLYCAGDIAWSAFYVDSDAAVTWADALYLWYSPLALLGVALLVRARISRFELSRWIDGVAAALLVATPATVLILEPTIRQSEGALLVKVVSVAYPLGDIVVLGSVVGAIALTGWRPGRAWTMLALGLSAFVAADSLYSVQNLTGTYSLGQYDFLWPLAGLLVATAAWLRPVRHAEVHAWGWRAIALPVLCQVSPIALLFLQDQPPSEQLMMTAVLAIVLVQLVVTRPRAPEGAPRPPRAAP